MDIISMAQHASPKPSGQMEFLRAQFTILSSCVKRMPSSSSNFPKSSGLSSVAFFPTAMLIPRPLSDSYFLTKSGEPQISTRTMETFLDRLENRLFPDDSPPDMRETLLLGRAVESAFQTRVTESHVAKLAGIVELVIPLHFHPRQPARLESPQRRKVRSLRASDDGDLNAQGLAAAYT